MEKAITVPSRSGRRRTLPASLLRGMLFALLTGAGLLLLAGYLLYRSEDPTAYIRPTSLAVAALSAVTGGAAAALGHGRGGVLCGIAVGGMLALLALLAALPLSGGTLTGDVLILYGLMLLGGALGGMMGSKRGARRRRRHR